eukprot:107796_1
MTIDSRNSFIVVLNCVSIPFVDNDLRQSIFVALLLTQYDERKYIDQNRATVVCKFVTLTACILFLFLPPLSVFKLHETILFKYFHHYFDFDFDCYQSHQ